MIFFKNEHWLDDKENATVITNPNKFELRASSNCPHHIHIHMLTKVLKLY